MVFSRSDGRRRGANTTALPTEVHRRSSAGSDDLRRLRQGPRVALEPDPGEEDVAGVGGGGDRDANVALQALVADLEALVVVGEARRGAARGRSGGDGAGLDAQEVGVIDGRVVGE